MKSNLFEIDISNCSFCYTCIRECPVKAIKIQASHGEISIIENRCIECGSCYQVCPEGAITFFDESARVLDMLKSKSSVVALLAPSAPSEFEEIVDYKKFVKMLRILGFDYVNEAAIGADLLKQKTDAFYADYNGKHYITTSCPVVLNYIEKYYPDLISNVAKLPSVMMLASAVCREIYGKDVKIVYIGPCIATKNEILRYEQKYRPDAVISFLELREIFEKKGVFEKQVEFSEFDQPWGYTGGLFPIGEGLGCSNNNSNELISCRSIIVQGKNDFMESIQHFDKHSEKIKKCFNVFFCKGCIMGPGTSNLGKRYLRRSIITEYVKKRSKIIDKEQWMSTINGYKNLELNFHMVDKSLKSSYKDSAIQSIIEKLGDIHLNKNYGCKSCGYSSCKDLAKAVVSGMAEPEMCYNYSYRTKKDCDEGLEKLQEKLVELSDLLKYQEDNAERESVSAQESYETIISLLQEIPSAVVIVDNNLKIIQSNKNFIRNIGIELEEINEVVPGLIGVNLKELLPLHLQKLFFYVQEYDENIMNRDIYLNDRFFNVSIFSIKKGFVVGAIFRDMYLPEIQKEQVVSRVREVVRKNFTMVQEIGFLLGEGASETEQMLDTIIETYSSNEKM
ncbi:MAG: [Fe-Fe] hydrogenase large subunit C-terminal domain-containing protein [Bacteroidales bacterium]